MSREWTLDTCVLYQAADNDMNAIFLMLKIKEDNDKVILDLEKEIIKQYRNCLDRTRDKKGHDLLRKWFVILESKLAKYVSSTLEDNHRKQLIELGFHRKDFPFVGACSKSSCKRIITNDSDYNDDVKEYLNSRMGIKVKPIPAS